MLIRVMSSLSVSCDKTRVTLFKRLCRKSNDHFFNMHFQYVVAAIEGFPMENGGYILRELTLLFPNDQEQHFQFKNPSNMCLNIDEMRTAKFCQRHLNGFSPTDDESCCLPAEVYPKILETIQHSRIYCAGETTRLFFARHLPDASITDVYSLFDFRYPKEFSENPGCFKMHRFRYCTLAKCRYLAQRLQGYRL